MTKQSQRVRPTKTQVTQLRELLADVPFEQRRDWATPAGQAFIATVRILTLEHGVPARWIADELGLPAGQIYVMLSRHRGQETA